MMIKIDAKAVADFLLQHEVDEPIVIKRQGAPHAAMIPCEIFQVMHRQNRKMVRVEELTDEEVEAILNSKPSAESYKYNDELDD